MINNLTHITNIRVEIPDSNRTINFVNSVQSVNLPSIECQPTTVSNNQMTTSYVPGSKIQFEPLRIRFLIDEHYKSYVELYRWITSLTNTKLSAGGMRDGYSPKTMLVHILDSSHKNIVCSFRFHDPFPSVIDEIEMGYNDDGNPSLTSMVTFYYSKMSVIVDGHEIVGFPEQRISPAFNGGHLHPFGK